QMGEGMPRTSDKIAETRRRAAHQAPGQAKQQQRQDAVAGPEMKLHPVAAQLGRRVGNDQQQYERPMEQTDGPVPDQNSLLAIFGHGASTSPGYAGGTNSTTRSRDRLFRPSAFAFSSNSATNTGPRTGPTIGARGAGQN